jgi:hypothetical protein
MLWYLFVSGIKGFSEGALPLLSKSLLKIWRLAYRWATTTVSLDKLRVVTNWCMLYIYSTLATLVEMLDSQHIRKLHRIRTSGSASIYIPRLNATLMGELADLSLTGAGVIVELPFKLMERERATVSTVGKDHEVFQVECFIMHTSKIGTKSFCGTSFIVDVFSFSKIIKYVSSNNLRILSYILRSGNGLVTQGRTMPSATELMPSALVRVLKIVVQGVAFLLLNPAYRAEITKEESNPIVRAFNHLALIVAFVLLKPVYFARITNGGRQ